MYGLSEESLTIVGVILIVVGVAMIGWGFEWNQDITNDKRGRNRCQRHWRYGFGNRHHICDAAGNKLNWENYTKEADAWMAEKQNLIARKTGTPIPAAQPTQATPAVPPPFVPTAPAKSHEYYCCLARWDGSYIGYETYKSEQAAQNARKQIARRGETAVYATVEEAEAWVEQQKAARTRR